MGSITGKPQAMKKVNSLLIKQMLKKRGSATKAELAETTGISQTTVRKLLDELIDKNEIVSVGLDKSSGGRRAERYELNLSESLIIGFYIGDKYIDYAIANPLGEIMEDNRVESSYKNHAIVIEKFLDELIKNNKIIKAIGISVSGIIDDGKYLSGKSFGSLKEYNIGEYLENKYKVPIVLENDLNSIAFGYSLNLMKKLHLDDLNILNMIYIHFTKAGIGAGIIANGELVRGGRNFAGELGFMPISSGTNLNYVIDNNPDNDSYADTVARVIAIINCVTNPDFVVIGGETFRAELIEQVKEACNKYIDSNIIPDIFLSEESRRDCLTGIIHFSAELMNSGIKLIGNSRKH